MTRDELLERICPNDASYDCSTGESGSCSKCDELLNKWLNEYDAEIINKFAEELKSRLGDAIHPKDFESMKNLIDDLARQTKEQQYGKEE